MEGLTVYARKSSQDIVATKIKKLHASRNASQNHEGLGPSEGAHVPYTHISSLNLSFPSSTYSPHSSLRCGPSFNFLFFHRRCHIIFRGLITWIFSLLLLFTRTCRYSCAVVSRWVASRSTVALMTPCSISSSGLVIRMRELGLQPRWCVQDCVLIRYDLVQNLLAIN